MKKELLSAKEKGPVPDAECQICKEKEDKKFFLVSIFCTKRSIKLFFKKLCRETDL